MIRLKYLIKSYKKSNIQAGEGQSEGPVPFYTSSEGLKLYYNYAQYPFDSISMGTGGFASINYSSVPFSTSTDCFNFSGSKKAYTKFLYYWIEFIASNIGITIAIINNPIINPMTNVTIGSTDFIAFSIFKGNSRIKLPYDVRNWKSLFMEAVLILYWNSIRK